ncbi:unnamed protein product [Vitrella brassicaformis CCMP3155]|uniref:cysteine--tRNA ligase n=2 Tax=Vitrella brassicaformis TaxID=1169539 RepID=A0A0G4ED21_VITBC|nr:unnamed protein product [Vitrella brassicaformis CCMP3155]|eukprot:CEL93242.1 unnamed protein product [Vitrella brassicaformis CCMP3155]
MGWASSHPQLISFRGPQHPSSSRGGLSTVSGSSIGSADRRFRLFDTGERTKRSFDAGMPSSSAAPLDSERVVRFYSCGPTVYDAAHIGNFRAFLTYDLLKRFLIYLGYTVVHVCNLTDVDDKIIQRMRDEGVSRTELTNTYTQLFFQDIKALNVLPATHYPRASDYIPQMQAMIQTLIDNGLAYTAQEQPRQQGAIELPAASVYFNVSKCERYGVLTDRRFLSGIRAGGGERDGSASEESEEVASDHADAAGTGKVEAEDFALWKAYKEEDGDVWWNSPWGRGRPGWHIECSAMAKALLGDTIDIHAGGIDLIFPHHENEIAQSEGASGQPFCRYWVHNGFVNINQEKMSKSKRNFLTLRQCCPTKDDVRAFRFLVVGSNYRRPLNFSAAALQSARNSVRRLDAFRRRLKAAAAQEAPHLQDLPSGDWNAQLINASSECVNDFEAHLLDDLNTPRAFAAMFKLIATCERALQECQGALLGEGLKGVSSALDRMDSVFGLWYDPVEWGGAPEDGTSEGETSETIRLDPRVDLPEMLEGFPAEILLLVEERAKAKSVKDYQAADKLRTEIETLGFSVKDLSNGMIELACRE